MSVAFIGPKLRTQRPRQTKIGTEVAHVTRDLDTTFKVKGQQEIGIKLNCLIDFDLLRLIDSYFLWWHSYIRICFLDGSNNYSALLGYNEF